VLRAAAALALAATLAALGGCASVRTFAVPENLGSVTTFSRLFDATP